MPVSFIKTRSSELAINLAGAAIMSWNTDPALRVNEKPQLQQVAGDYFCGTKYDLPALDGVAATGLTLSIAGETFATHSLEWTEVSSTVSDSDLEGTLVIKAQAGELLLQQTFMLVDRHADQDEYPEGSKLTQILTIHNAGGESIAFTAALRVGVVLSELAHVYTEGEYSDLASLAGGVQNASLGQALTAASNIDRLYSGYLQNVQILDVGASRDRTANDHSSVSTHADLQISRSNLPDVRVCIASGTSGCGMLCESGAFAGASIGPTLQQNSRWVCGHSLTASPRF